MHGESHETVNRLTEVESTEPSWKGNLAKKRGREVLERGRDRYKAEEGWDGVRVVVYSCSVSREIGEREEEAVNEQIIASHRSCGVHRAPGTMLTSITTVWHMCMCVWLGLMCKRVCESLESGGVVNAHTHTHTHRVLLHRHSLHKRHVHTLACRGPNWLGTLVILFLGIKLCWWLSCC